jgi:flavodoxin
MDVSFMSFFKKEKNIKDGKSLIIYFSHTGENYMSDGIRNIDKGNTEIVAEFLKDITNADLFKVEKIENYPYNYQECCNVAKEELNNNARPMLKKYLENIDNYEVVYILSPVWWGQMPMPLFSQLEKLNWDKKIVKYITTHEGSGLGIIPNAIEKICKGADIRKGLAIRGSNAKNSKNIIEKWLD